MRESARTLRPSEVVVKFVETTQARPAAMEIYEGWARTRELLFVQSAMAVA